MLKVAIVAFFAGIFPCTLITQKELSISGGFFHLLSLKAVPSLSRNNCISSSVGAVVKHCFLIFVYDKGQLWFSGLWMRKQSKKFDVRE
ncbi:hypothetical protein [Paenibacillus thalictri]|uniref:hypothetical protein n=1 Tax=Paenibacillus thalictri TaxID=2527873 RepID=UPI001033436E|nr:hypothetical protein [Paenibacillus thalictri]